MVAARVIWLFGLLAQVEAKPQIPPPTRWAAMMALLAIALLGMLLVVIILLGGHWVRRLGTHRRGPAVPPDLVLPNRRATQHQKPPQAEQSTDETTITSDTQNT